MKNRVRNKLLFLLVTITSLLLGGACLAQNRSSGKVAQLDGYLLLLEDECTGAAIENSCPRASHWFFVPKLNELDWGFLKTFACVYETGWIEINTVNYVGKEICETPFGYQRIFPGTYWVNDTVRFTPSISTKRMANIYDMPCSNRETKVEFKYDYARATVYRVKLKARHVASNTYFGCNGTERDVPQYGWIQDEGNQVTYLYTMALPMFTTIPVIDRRNEH